MLPRTARRTAPTISHFRRFRQPERISDATGEPRGAILENVPTERLAAPMVDALRLDFNGRPFVGAAFSFARGCHCQGRHSPA